MARRMKRSEPLEAYRAKRDFAKTPEPAPDGEEREQGRTFVVQQHDARRMHWDFRLEHDGALLSWAVPKGPSLDPRERRLAVRTEDHPIAYGGFEGLIPKGEYGGGAVLLWDRGTWVSEGDPSKALEKGHLRFELEGERMHGRWNLVRTGDGDQWLLIKGKDAYARSGDGDRLVRGQRPSVASGRTLEAIAREPDRVWRSNTDTEPLDPSALDGAEAAAMPRTMSPTLATLVKTPPKGDEWLHEIKLDGYRLLARVDGGEACLFTRRGNDWTSKLPSLARALGALPLECAWLDGEIVVMDAQGKSDFGALQAALAARKDASIRYIAFDLLHLDGYDLCAAALSARKALLRTLLARSGSPMVRFGDHVRGEGQRFYEEVCRLGLEGMVSKRAGRPYASRRTNDWRKIKCSTREKAVVIGFTEPSGSREGFGALLLAQPEDGALVYVGKVGTGFDERTLRALHTRLRPLELDRPPIEGVPREVATRRTHWVKPALTVEVTFAERSKAGRLRHPSFVGLCEERAPASTPAKGKNARGVVRASVAGVALSNPERIYFPDAGLTKRELAEYYASVADFALPHLVRRPLTLVRCPDGVGASCFFMQHAFRGMPRAIHRVRVKDEKGAADHVYVRDLAGLVTLVQFGALELHTWSARHPDLETPDQLVFDLDPGSGVTWAQIVEGALAVRSRLAELGLPSFVKTTGGSGLHVVAPIAPTLPWKTTKAFAHALARELARQDAARFVATVTKSKRKGKIYIDYVRNTRGATAVAPYSTRARGAAPVSTPLTWEELEAGVDPARFDVRTVPKRMGQLARDPWEGFFERAPQLTPAMREAVGAA